MSPETGERKRDLRRPALSGKQFVSGVEEMLKLRTSEFPGFTFSNKLKCVDTETSLLNDNGLNYISMDRYYETTMLPYELMAKFSSDLRGDMFGRNESMFRDNLGKKLFASDFTLFMDRSEEMIGVPFFDKEGSTLDGDKTEIIKGAFFYPHIRTSSAPKDTVIHVQRPRAAIMMKYR